jgi:hypothetical protein
MCSMHHCSMSMTAAKTVSRLGEGQRAPSPVTQYHPRARARTRRLPLDVFIVFSPFDGCSELPFPRRMLACSHACAPKDSVPCQSVSPSRRTGFKKCDQDHMGGVQRTPDILAPPHAWTTFQPHNPDLLVYPSPLLEQRYRPETLSSAFARQIFALPDRALPSQ